MEKEMATHPSILAWRIPRIEEPGGLQSTGSQRVGHDWATSLYYHVMLKFIKKHLGGSIINMFHFYKCNGTFILSCIFQHLGKYSIWFSRMTDVLSFNPIAWCQYFHCIFDKKGKILPKEVSNNSELRGFVTEWPGQVALPSFPSAKPVTS